MKNSIWLWRFSTVLLICLLVSCGMISKIDNPKTAMDFYNNGLYYDEIGDIGHAKECINRSIEIDSTNPIVYTDRGVMYMNDSNYVKALADFNKAIRLTGSREFTLLYINRAGSFFAIGDTAHALADLNTAINFSFLNYLAYYYRGLYYLNKGNYTDALNDFNCVINLTGSEYRAYAYTKRGNIYQHNQNYACAMKDYNIAIQKYRKTTIAWIGLGSVYNDVGKYKQSIRAYTRAIKLEPKTSEIYYKRAEVYAKNGDTIWQRT